MEEPGATPGPDPIRQGDRQDADVPRSPPSGRHIAKGLEQASIVLGVRRVLAGVAARPHAWPAAERVDFQAGIVREGRQSGCPEPEPSLDRRVRLERLPGLGGILGNAQVVESDELCSVQTEQLA
jgi:hypothetical protein